MSNNRAKTVLLIIILGFAINAGRFFYWQIIQGPPLAFKALSQTIKPEKINPIQGTIYSSDAYPIAFSTRSYSLSIYKPNLKDQITQIIELIINANPNLSKRDQETLKNFSINDSQKWVTLKSDFTYSQKGQLQKPGISFTDTDQRIYPETGLATDIIKGLERYYQKQLHGKSGYIWSTKDATGQTIINKRNWQDEVKNGIDLHTSINRSIQHLVEKSINEGVIRYQADSAAISIIRPIDGQVIAMASYNQEATASSEKITPISDLFEPGSIFKPLVVAMALDTKAINTNFVCTKCNTPRLIGQYTITNWDNATHPDSNLEDIIKNSDNIGMSYIIDQLGEKNFLKYFDQLKLNNRTGIDLPGEAKPIPKKYWSNIDLATASFGQGFAVNQLQILSAFNAIADNGIYHPPKVTTSNPNKQIKVFQEGTTDKVKAILKYAVESGVVSQFKPKNLEACAKSGTAQVAIDGKYADPSTIASYIGFSPCNRPKFTMIVTINNPRSSPWGSSTAAPIWYDLAEKIQNLL